MPESIKSQIRNYLSLSKKEWNGMVILLILIVTALIAPEVYIRLHQQPVLNERQLQEALTQLNQVDKIAGHDDDQEAVYSSPQTLFHFNPNLLDEEGWAKLGLTPHQITTIQHYKAKGGRFISKHDVRKMYALTTADYDRLEPYIDLPDSVNTGKKPPAVHIELNTADSARLTQVNGIGPAFAMRIVHYRERLGGFHHKEQLKEVFGIDEGMYDEIKDQFTLHNNRVKQIHINQAELADLKNNPYLNYKQANAIVQYRKQHGDYESLTELKNIAILDEQILRKLAPYLAFK